VPTSEGGTAVYQIAFDKADGDFSKPLYMASSDNNGYSNHATVTHELLNKLSARAGYLSSETGNLKWTVFASKGTNVMKSSKENTLAVTRLAGFDEDKIPIEVFVTGAASEGGTDLSKAHQMTSLVAGSFEVYTQLKAGEPYHFVHSKEGTQRKFYTADTEKGILVMEGEQTATVPVDGIYRITINFTTGACTYTLVNGVWFYFSPDGKNLFELPYAGYGVFRADAQTVTFKQEGWGRDQRYKFRMFIKEDGGADDEREVEWGTLNGTDSPPNEDSPDTYYHLKLLQATSQWDDKWKLMSKFDGVPAEYTLYLNADQPYTHSVK
jgi:hypothetical protein